MMTGTKNVNISMSNGGKKSKNTTEIKEYYKVYRPPTIQEL